MKNKLDERRFTFIAQVDSFFEKKQYQRGGRCIRFIAIDQKDEIKLTSKDQDEERGVNTYTLELTNFIPRKDEYKINKNEDVWYKIEGYWTRENPNGYAYLTFGNSEPEYFRFQKRTKISKPHIKSIEILKNNNNFINNVEICPRSELNNGNVLFKFYAFHVGQGLCSLITDSSDYGLLLDAGVGTPIKRNFYQNKLSVNDNDLIMIINNIENIDLVLSHADSDHWRLLAWDNILLSKVKNIYVPSNAKALIYWDKKITDLIRPSGDFKVNLTDGAWVNVFRSNPNVNSNNNDCLVSVYYNNDSDSCVLQSGDYIYKHMNKDMSSHINSLGGIQYTAIVVPHHGDKHSASEVYSPKLIDSSVAFFSAGDHHYYNHPTCESKVAHSKKGFKVIKNTHSMKIIAVQLA